MGERLTTVQAEARTGATRWAIIRAHNAGHLRGERDNRGRWKWDSDELDAWAVKRPSPQEPEEKKDEAQPPALWEALAEARERAARAEGEAEGLRLALGQAEKRAEAAEERLREAQARRRWFPWSKTHGERT